MCSPTQHLSSPAAALSSPQPQQQSREQQQARLWDVEASGLGLVVRLEGGRDLGPAALARLAAEIEEVRFAGFEIALACGPGQTLEALRGIRFHRFVDVLPSRDAAWRWLATSRRALKAA